MRYPDFESIMTSARMGRYLTACAGNTRKAMTLYRKNLQLSQELFTIISCFEITLRNAIDRHYTVIYGSDWLRDAVLPGGIFDNNQCRSTKININDAIQKLNNSYTHHKLVAELGFGFWRYMFANNQYRACGKTLLRILPAKPASTPSLHYNQQLVFNHLVSINDIRNRIAHHEPICFVPRNPVKDTSYARQHYNLILQLFQWMSIDQAALLYGLDHITAFCDEIDSI